MAVEHEIRATDGEPITVSLTPTRAIKAFCMECLGFEGHPRDCEARLCPLWPFRGRTLLSNREAMRKSRERADEMRGVNPFVDP